ncbi:hypothetical protein L2D71_32590, partial [Pseudomonas aeruginosa]|uniref:hypothetical protein n=1 Tax=Pseudomonas aeruginosa TaxID=287 RepID=UPI001F2BF359
AENAGIIDASERKVLIQAARDLFYPDRTFARMLDAAPLPAARKPPLQDWLTAHRVDQKADDARALLRRMRDDATRDPAPPPS